MVMVARRARQDDSPAHGGRLEDITQGRCAGGPVVKTCRQGPQRGMVFQSYALYPHMTCREHRLRPAPAQDAQGPGQGQGGRDGHCWPVGVPGPQPASSRWPAQRCHGPGRGARAVGVLDDEPLSNLDAKMRVQMRSNLAHPAPVGCHVVRDHDQTEHDHGDRWRCCTWDASSSATPPRSSTTARQHLRAAFIGSPAMTCTRPAHADATELRVGSQSVNLTPRSWPPAQARLYRSKTLVMGCARAPLRRHPARLGPRPGTTWSSTWSSSRRWQRAAGALPGRRRAAESQETKAATETEELVGLPIQGGDKTTGVARSRLAPTCTPPPVPPFPSTPISSTFSTLPPVGHLA